MAAPSLAAAKEGTGKGNELTLPPWPLGLTAERPTCRPDRGLSRPRSRRYAELRRAESEPRLRSLVTEGDLPGALWKQGLFKGAGPR